MNRLIRNMNYCRLNFYWEPLLAFILPFIVYVITLAPTIYNLDSAELTTAAATLGLARSTGYPLYILLGYLWSHIPAGDVGFRLNLFSAFFGALSVALGWVILRKWSVNRWAASGALGLMACAPFFWALSLVAEVYTLQTALMAFLILLLDDWIKAPTALRFGFVGLSIGLCLDNHMATLLLMPGVAFLIMSRSANRLFRLNYLLHGLFGLLIGLSLYLYLPVRYHTMPLFNYAGLYDAMGVFHPVNLASWKGFLDLVFGGQFSNLMFHYDSVTLSTSIQQIGLTLWRSFFIIGIGPGLLGVWVLIRRNLRWGITLILMFAGNVIFYIGYRAIDVETMYLPIIFIWGLWLGIGYQQISTWLEHSTILDSLQKKIFYWSNRLFQAIIIGSVFVAIFVTWPSVDRSQDWSSRERGETILQELEQNALYLGWWDTAPVMEYLQLVERQRQDVKIINRFLIKPMDVPILAIQQAAYRPVYISKPVPVEIQKTSEVLEGVFRVIVIK